METLSLTDRGVTLAKNISTKFSDLFFPQVCYACEENNKLYNHIFCMSCAFEIAKTDHWQCTENSFTKKFIGRVPLFQGGALYKFIDGGIFQKIVHKLKYENKPNLGLELGKIAGSKIINHWHIPDYIIPVPMATAKLWKRGYNQAEKISKGLSETIQKPVLEALRKTHATISQTGFHRIERVQNMSGAFELNTKLDLRGKHVLLVDDVLTTGATLEACALPLFAIEDIKISMVTMGIGSEF